MEKFNVVIVGGGPSGLSAAKALAEPGGKVVVLEKNSIIGSKICAGGLTLKDIEWGIPLSLLERVFHALKIHISGKTVEVGRGQPFVATINREKLGQWMVKQVEKNVEIRLNSEVVEIKNNSVLLKDGEELQFDYLIGADGSFSQVRQYLGIPIKRIWPTLQYTVPKSFEELEIFFEPKKFGHGYVWIFPHGDYTVIGCGGDSQSQKIGELQENFHLWLEERKINIGNSRIEACPINFDYRGFNFGNIFLVGDAAGFASGLTGEGIYSAIISGQEIAQKILDPNYDCPKLKKVLRIKIGQEKIGRFLMFKILKSEKLTQFIFNKFI